MGERTYVVSTCGPTYWYLQCAPLKLRYLIIIIASSTEIATSWNLSCVCGLPLCGCWQFFFILRQNFSFGELLARKKTLATSQVYFCLFARKLAKQKIFALGWLKYRQHQHKGSHTHKKNLRMLGCGNFYGKCNYTHQRSWDLRCM